MKPELDQFPNDDKDEESMVDEAAAAAPKMNYLNVAHMIYGHARDNQS